jgi:hypothetical protein
MKSTTVKFSLRDTHNAHTVTFTSWYKVSPEITLIKPLGSIIDEEKHLPIQLDYKAHYHI